jgi:MraZ protein
VFHGRHEYTIDDRGRVPIPPQFRALLGEGPVWLVEGAEECLELYTHSEYERYREEIDAIPASQDGRRVRRAFYSSSHRLSLDKAGRVLIPLEVREEAGLSGPVVLVGRGNVLELWAKPVWEAERKRTKEQYASALDRALENRQ